jgi:hypothetical protein
MHIPTRDLLASLLVGAGLVLYGAWLMGFAVPGFGSPGTVALGVLVLGIGASASAVVPGFAELLRGSRTYLALSSGLGLLALGGGLWAVLGGDPLGLALLMLAMLVLWAMSTYRHLEASQARGA